MFSYFFDFSFHSRVVNRREATLLIVSPYFGMFVRNSQGVVFSFVCEEQVCVVGFGCCSLDNGHDVYFSDVFQLRNGGPLSHELFPSNSLASQPLGARSAALSCGQI